MPPVWRHRGCLKSRSKLSQPFYADIKIFAGSRTAHFEKRSVKGDFPRFEKYLEFIRDFKASIIGERVVAADDQFAVFNGIIVVFYFITDVNDAAFQCNAAVFGWFLPQKDVGRHEEIFNAYFDIVGFDAKSVGPLFL